MHRDTLTYKTLSAQSRNITLLLLNAVGAAIYVYRASPSWAIPQERAAGIYSVTGEPFVWFDGILPVVVVFFIVDLAWGALALRRSQWRDGRWWMLAPLCWLLAVWIDFAHH